MKKDNKPYRILVVEDNPGDRAFVIELLMEQIAHPFTANAVNFKEVCRILSEADTPFDVILLDLSLTDMSGQALIDEMLRIALSCPIIILTGYADIDFSVKSISQGIMDYLLKDGLNATTLYKSIVYAIERKKAISELKDSERRYSNLFNLSPQPMWLFDLSTFYFLQVNHAATLLYGYSEKEFLGMTLMDIACEEDVFNAGEFGGMPQPVDGIYKKTALHHKKSGDIIEVEIYSNLIEINDTNFGSVIAFDITEKNQFEQKIVKAIIKTQDDERYEIGGELHDNVCQILATSLLGFNMLRESMPAAKIPFFIQCTNYINDCLVEIRNLSHRLAPVFLQDSTMEGAFRRLFSTFNMDKKTTIVLHFDDFTTNHPISLELQLNLYRILQEQLRNIQKYAGASAVEVEVFINNNKLRMSVADNGIGFKADAVSEGIGLANMKRRAELFSGSFDINSSPGNGCKIIINIPLQEAA